jgi:hypothetical protein
MCRVLRDCRALSSKAVQALPPGLEEEPRYARSLHANEESQSMKNAAIGLVIVIAATLAAPVQAQSSQYPVADQIAAKVIAKYQNSSCQQLAQQKQQQQPPSRVEQKAIAELKSDPQMRAYFINKIAGPIANKMFECGMIP